jgi:hypothetical protein
MFMGIDRLLSKRKIRASTGCPDILFEIDVLGRLVSPERFITRILLDSGIARIETDRKFSLKIQLLGPIYPYFWQTLVYL